MITSEIFTCYYPTDSTTRFSPPPALTPDPRGSIWNPPQFSRDITNTVNFAASKPKGSQLQGVSAPDSVTMGSALGARRSHQWRSQRGVWGGGSTPHSHRNRFFHSRKVTVIKYYNLSLS